MLTPERRAKIRAEILRQYPNGPPANRKQIDEIVGLAPQWKETIWKLVREGLLEKDANRLLEELRRPRLPAVSSGTAERLHQQSAELLAEKHWEELERTRELEARQQRYQQIIDYWHEQRLADEARERHFRQGLDPCRLGLYGPIMPNVD